MNLSLVDPFILAQDYPESLTGKLSTEINQILDLLLICSRKDPVMQPVLDSIAKEIFLLQAGYDAFE